MTNCRLIGRALTASTAISAPSSPHPRCTDASTTHRVRRQHRRRRHLSDPPVVRAGARPIPRTVHRGPFIDTLRPAGVSYDIRNRRRIPTTRIPTRRLPGFTTEWGAFLTKNTWAGFPEAGGTFAKTISSRSPLAATTRARPVGDVSWEFTGTIAGAPPRRPLVAAAEAGMDALVLPSADDQLYRPQTAFARKSRQPSAQALPRLCRQFHTQAFKKSLPLCGGWVIVHYLDATVACSRCPPTCPLRIEQRGPARSPTRSSA